MSKLQINLLGGFTVTVDDRPLTEFRSAKARGLLAYVATQSDREHARATLATLLWGELSDSAAMTNLRIELSNVNKVLGKHPALIITRNTVRFDSQSATVDVFDFQSAVKRFGALPLESQTTHLIHLTTALAHYRGEFLAGFSLTDAPEFDEWQLLMREQLHEQAMQALTLLQQRHAEQGNWPALAVAARDQLALVPWQESAHRNLMQALAAQGQRGAALEQYAKCRAVLHTELGIEPTSATQEIAVRLRASKPAVAATQHNLPQQSKSLVGRTTEINEVAALVQQERLVTLLGLGGVGKSRLALAVAQETVHCFSDGVWFVALANIPAIERAPDRIALAIAAALSFPLTDMQAPLAELTSHFADKTLLLILDNWDEITMAAEELCEQLLSSPGVHILATSRVRLQVEQERVVHLQRLSPQESTQLFVERAQRLVPTFTDAGQMADIRQICEAVAGLPLGIELTASWIEHFPVADIGQSLAEIAAAPNYAADYAPRHQRLDAVFEYSWRLLSPSQQQLLSRLSVFRGGFDRDAVRKVAAGNLSDLSLLIAHSLVHRLSAGRYDLHPLIQEFAAHKVTPAVTADLFTAHSMHYLTRLAQTEPPHRAQLHIDDENMRSAWQRAITAGALALLATSARAFGAFIAQYGLTADGNNLFAQAVAHVEGLPNQAELLANLLDQQAIFLRRLQGLRATEPVQLRVLSLTQNPQIRTNAHFDLANYYAEQGMWSEAEGHFDQAEELAQASGDLGRYIAVVEERIHINAIHFRGDFGAGVARLEELLQLLNETTMSDSEAQALRYRIWQSLPILTMRHRDYAAAIRYAGQALAVARQFAQRDRECQILLDMALAEQFAGLYAQAIAHNEAALAIAEAIGDADEAALLHANLCLTLRQCGQLAAALAHGTTALAQLQALGNRRIEGQARNRVGHTLLALEQWERANHAYGAALAVWEPLQHPNRYEAVAGQAVARYHLEEKSAALALVAEVLGFVEREGLAGVVEPMLLLLHCEIVLSGCGDREGAALVLQQAQHWLTTIAARISDEKIRQVFLSRPDHQRLTERAQQAAALQP